VEAAERECGITGLNTAAIITVMPVTCPRVRKLYFGRRQPVQASVNRIMYQDKCRQRYTGRITIEDLSLDGAVSV